MMVILHQWSSGNSVYSDPVQMFFYSKQFYLNAVSPRIFTSSLRELVTKSIHMFPAHTSKWLQITFRFWQLPISDLNKEWASASSSVVLSPLVYLGVLKFSPMYSQMVLTVLLLPPRPPPCPHVCWWHCLTLPPHTAFP